MKKLIMLFSLLVLLAGSTWGVTFTIGTGTTTGRYPLNDYWAYSRSQSLYLSSEITSGGTITHLRWYRDDTGADPSAIGTTEIWLMETASTTLSGTTWEGPGTLVASISNIDLGAGGGWYDIDITDFVYSGTSNLLVSVYTQDAPFTSPHSFWRYTATSNYMMRAGNSDDINPPGMALSYSRPNIQFEMTLTNPFLTLNPSSLSFGYVAYPGSSTERTYSLSGDNLTTGPIVVTAPVGFGVSLTTGGPYTSSVNVNYTPPTLGATTIFSKFTPLAANTTYINNITNAGGGATGNVSVTGSSDLFSLYCPSAAGSIDDEDILNVTIASLNNTSTCSTTGGSGSILNMYSNYKSPVLPVIDLQQGSTNPFSVQVGTCGGNYLNAIKIFIDFNQNGDFNDPGEEVFVSPSSVSGPHTETGTIFVPLATLGNTLMRVINVEAITPSGILACGTYGYGETEDYTVNIIPPAGCSAPITLSASGITSTSAQLNWVEVGSATSWQIEWGLQGYTTGTKMVVGSHPYTLNPPFTANTPYSFRVRAICGANDTSSWSGSFNFITACNAITTLPHAEGFEKYLVPDCWTSTLISGPNPWVDTTNMLTEVPAPHSGSRCAAKYYGTSVALLTSPQFNIPLVSGNMEMTIWVFRGQYAHASDSITFFANTIPSITGATRLGMIQRGISYSPTEAIEGWYEYTFTVPPVFNGVPFNIMILGTTAGGSISYSIGVDDFTLQLPTTCPAPTNLTAAVAGDSVTFNCTSSASEFQIEIGLTGFVIGTGYRFDVPMPIMAVAFPDGCYETYVRAVCGPGDTSAWSLPVTYCVCTSIYTPPYFEGFEGTVFPPLCWSQTISDSAYTWHLNADSYYEGSHSASVEYDPSLNLQDEWLKSPQFDLTGVSHAQVKFAWSGSKYWSMFPYNNCDLNLMIKTGGSWTKIWDQFDTDTATYTNFSWRVDSVDISAYTGGTVKFAFQYTGTDGAQFLVDAFTLEETPYMDLTVHQSNIHECDTLGWFAPPFRIVNVGSETVSSGAITQISYSADGATFIVDNYTFMADLLPGDSVLAFFTTPYHFDQFTTLNAIFAVTFPGDMNIMNDTANFTVTFEHPPIVDLGIDTAICTGNSLVLDAGGNPGDTYLWNTSASTKTITVSTAGTYGVVVTSPLGCIGHDSIVVAITTRPTPSLFGSNNVCRGVTYVYNTNSGKSNYIWNISAGGTIVGGGTSSDYIVTVTWNNVGTESISVNYEENGCSALTPNSQNVFVQSNPVVNLGPDQIICNNQTTLLDAGNPGATFSWWNGSPTQQHLIDVSYCSPNSTCLYWVNVTLSGCTTRDSIYITFDPCTGIDENGNANVSLYPNPTNGIITIELNGYTGKILLTIHSLHGQLMYSEEFENVSAMFSKQLDLSALNKGVYFVKAQNSSYQVIRKLIIE